MEHPEPERPLDADVGWMRAALACANASGAQGEVPVGAVVVLDGRLLARSGNATIVARDPAGHAEVLALRAAAAAVGTHRLPGAVLYATVEPCVMCMGVALQARVARVVYGCADPKGGAAGSLYDLGNDRRLNHRIVVTAGVEAEACRSLMQEFFRSRRGSAV